MSRNGRMIDISMSQQWFRVAIACVAFGLVSCKPQREGSVEPQVEAAKPQSSAQEEMPKTTSPAETAVAVVAADAGRNDANASLCGQSERVLFSCVLENTKKIASLCASANVSETDGHFYYAHGSKASPDLVFPIDRTGSMSTFKRAHLMFAGNTGGYAYSFDLDGDTHAIYSISGSEGLENQGVAIFKDDFKKVHDIQQCDPSTVIQSDDESLIGLTLKWKRDSRIEENGIPAS
jgi:hypothetical protein